MTLWKRLVDWYVWQRYGWCALVFAQTLWQTLWQRDLPKDFNKHHEKWVRWEERAARRGLRTLDVGVWVQFVRFGPPDGICVRCDPGVEPVRWAKLWTPMLSAYLRERAEHALNGGPRPYLKDPHGGDFWI